MSILITDLIEKRKSLEFGNKEHIEAIDKYIEGQKEAEENKEIYEVEFAISGSVITEIEAQDEDEAKEIAEDFKFDLIEEADLDIDFLDIHLKGT